MQKRIAVFFETSEGHTASVAQRICEALESAGHVASMRRCGEAKAEDVSSADAAIIGSPIHMGKHDSKALHFARAHAELLNARPSALFLVCLTARSSLAQDAAEVARYLEAFRAQSGFAPALSRAFAGALLYTQYGFVKRKIMKSINEKNGGDTDTSRDFVYTDWSAVDAFARELLALAR